MTDFSKKVDEIIIISADNQDLTTNIWKIDGDIQPESDPVIIRKFSTPTTISSPHIITHEGYDTCGLCSTQPIEHNLYIAGTATKQQGVSPIIFGALAFGTLAVVMMKGNQGNK